MGWTAATSGRPPIWSYAARNDGESRIASQGLEPKPDIDEPARR